MIPLRDENPTRITPLVTWAFVAINVIMFLAEVSGGMGAARSGLAGPLAGWTLVPAEWTRGIDVSTNGPSLQPVWLTALTSMFLHGSWMHLLGNMLFLIIFGNNVEDALGHVRYVFFYLTTGFAATASQIFFTPDSVVPMLGASGAIAGVLGGYFLLYPQARVHTLVFLGFFITTLRVPAFLLLGFWLLSQFFNQFTGALFRGGDSQGGVAYLAHIGGFIAGMILVFLLGGRSHRGRPEPEIVYVPTRRW